MFSSLCSGTLKYVSHDEVGQHQLLVAFEPLALCRYTNHQVSLLSYTYVAHSPKPWPAGSLLEAGVVTSIRS